MYFVGETRFSLFEPTSGSWRLSKTAGRVDVEDYKAKLYAEDRMESRCAIFFNHTLPTLDVARGNNELIHVISYSEELPPKYQDRLQEEAFKYSWVQLDKRTKGDRRGTSVVDLVKGNLAPGTIYGNYRLDDDDVLASNYFDQVGAYLDERHVGMIVSLGYGVLALYRDGRFTYPKGEHRPKVAAGYCKICLFDGSGNFYTPTNISHTRADRENPVILDSREVSFLRSLHVNQDMAVANPKFDFQARLRQFERMPDLTEDVDLAKIFPTVNFMIQ